MFMPCPHCGFLVAPILPAQATGPDGAVQHCPRCDGALRVEPEPIDPMDSDPSASAESGTPVADGEADRADPETAPPGAVPASNAPEPDASLADRRADSADAVTSTAKSVARVAPPPAARTRRPPSFVRANTPTQRSRVAWPWYTSIGALGLVLALQLLLAQRHELAASARWRPWVAGLCRSLPCAIPAWREPQAFTMLDRSVQPSAAMPGVLAVEANFRNDARWPQPWPTLVLSLLDVEGRQVGVRAFAPSEYRAGIAGADDLLAPGQSAMVRLQVREPTPRIVAFTFDFQ